MTRGNHASKTFSWVDDEELRELILTFLHEERAFRVVDEDPQPLIVVEVQCGIVTLSGMVRSSVEWRAVDRLVRALGVFGLYNRLRVESDIIWKPD